MVIGVVVTGGGVEPRAPETGDEVVVFVGDGIVGGLDVEAVDFLLYLFSFGLVFGGSEFVILHRDGVEQRAFLGVIHRTDFVGALEQDVFKIVGQTGVGAVGSTRFHHHGTEHLGL